VRGPRAPATSLNRRVRPGRRIGVLRLELREVRRQARRSGANVNDVALDLYAQGLRDLLVSRGGTVTGLVPRTGVAVSLRSGREARGLGNRVGVLTLPLPVGEADAGIRLERIVRGIRTARAQQHPAVAQAALSRLAATPLARPFIAHQRGVKVFSTYLVGPVASVRCWAPASWRSFPSSRPPATSPSLSAPSPTPAACTWW